ncbi:MAG: hypothetical protein Q8829_02820 [Candidatus Phytoplasma australasiaticum]|nr:hypothetical protein [Candidatus Phytoplasma australasiaticum]
MNGKIGVNKSNNFAFVVDAPRKQCQKCGSTNHLTHLCKKAVSEPKVGACKYNEEKDEIHIPSVTTLIAFLAI